MEIHFGEEALKVLKLARDVRRDQGLPVDRPEDLLVALSSHASVAKEVLASFGLSTRSILGYFEDLDLETARPKTLPTDQLRFKTIKDRAIMWAQNMESPYVEPCHLLLSVIGEKRGYVQGCLFEHNTLPTEIGDRVREHLASLNVSALV